MQESGIVISSGRSSVVFRCIVKGDTGKDEQLTAMKVVEEKDVAFREIGIMLTLGHPNIIDLLDIIETEQSVGIVMPLMNMDLRMFMQCVEYSENEIRGIMTQSMAGVHHMHTRDIVHMDIKPENIGINVMDAVNCVTEKLQCKLLDLGSSIDIGALQHSIAGRHEKSLQSPKLVLSVRTTKGYQSPELERRGLISPACDIYSMGVVFEELISASNIVSDGLIFDSLPNSMLCHDFEERPSSREVLVRLGNREIRTPLLMSLHRVLDERPPIWASLITNTLLEHVAHESMQLVEMFIHDGSNDIQKLVTLVCSSDARNIRDAFWMLFEVSNAEVHGRHGLLSVVSVLNHFDSRVSASVENMLFYVKSLDLLSQMPGFVLSDEMRHNLCRATTVSRACERPVIRCLRNIWSRDVQRWCADLSNRWGAGLDTFLDFVSGFRHDWDTPCSNAAVWLTGK